MNPKPNALLLPKAPSLVLPRDLGKTTSPPPAPADTPELALLRDMLTTMERGGIGAEAKVALCLNLTASLAAELPYESGSRGKVINGLTEELRKRLRAVLPQRTVV
jgi:hypothetical protein